MTILLADNMRTVVFASNRDDAEVVSIIQTTSHHVDGEWFDFATGREAATFVANFAATHPKVRITGEYTRRAVATINSGE